MAIRARARSYASGVPGAFGAYVNEVVTPVSAARFLTQGGLSSAPSEVAAVQSQGFSGWVDTQLALPREKSFIQWQLDNAAATGLRFSSEVGFDAMINSLSMTTNEHLRYRAGQALNRFVTTGLPNVNIVWPSMTISAYMDILWDEAFGNYRNILRKIARSAAMGFHLTFIGSKKATGDSRPDENFAREWMQLFSVGTDNLNPDGSLVGGVSTLTYNLGDVKELARVTTGWVNAPEVQPSDYSPYTLPTVVVPGDHDLGAKTFLGQTIPAYAGPESIATYALNSLNAAADILFNHPNCAPFVALRMIKGMVTSNPSAAYIGRVAAKFINNGSGERGDMKAVLRQVLLDPEARNDAAALASTTFGRQRNPVQQLNQFFRTFPATVSGILGWELQDPNAGYFLVEATGRDPSVFGFFNPYYSPAGSAIFAAGLTAPEHKLTNETTIVLRSNYFQVIMQAGSINYNTGGAPQTLTLDFSAPLAIQSDSQALVDWINLYVVAGQLGAPTRAIIKAEVDAITVAYAPLNNVPRQRVFAALTLAMASPDYLGFR